MLVPDNYQQATRLKDMQLILRDNPNVPKTAIMATIGPSSFLPEENINLIPKMVVAGMNIVRINLAHVKEGKHRECVIALLSTLRKSVIKSREPIIVTIDLAGPKIRIGAIRGSKSDDGKEFIAFKKDDNMILTLDPNYGVKDGSYGMKETKLSLHTGKTDFNIKGITKGTRVSMDDGCFHLEVTDIDNNDIHCIARNDWNLMKDKGVNFPGCRITASALTSKDYDDLDWLFDRNKGEARGLVDYISLSFVKRSEDVSLLREYLDARLDQKNVRIISKIETAEAVSGGDEGYPTFKGILEVSDAIMIARGDLGAEVPFEDVPEIQRDLIEMAHKARKPAIVATQMLEFMVDHDFATRAEVTDVTYAILEGADVTMLSKETSGGKDPEAVVRTMQTIAKRACGRIKVLPEDSGRSFPGNSDSTIDAIAHPVVEFATKLKAKLIVSFTHSGETPIAIAHYRPEQPVIAITYKRDTVARLGLYQGIYTVYINYAPKNPDDHREICRHVLQTELNLTDPGDLSVVTLSMDPSAPAQRETNALYVLRH